MMKQLWTRSLSVITAGALLVSAGSAQALVSFDFLPIGNAGNGGYTDGAILDMGAVAYEYNADKYETTNDQYVEFLNAVGATDSVGMWDAQQRITRAGVAGAYTYTSYVGQGTEPIKQLHQTDAMRFINWLENGQPVGATGPATTEMGVYDVSLGFSAVRALGATYFLPTQDEWTKAAYHKNDGVTANYWLYGTSSNALPVAEVHPGGANSANYAPAFGNALPVGGYSATSPYGLYDATGNVDEFTEEDSGGFAPISRGGGFNSSSTAIQNDDENINNNNPGIGFRVFSMGGGSSTTGPAVPEPATVMMSLLGLIGLGLVAYRRRRCA